MESWLIPATFKECCAAMHMNLPREFEFHFALKLLQQTLKLKRNLMDRLALVLDWILLMVLRIYRGFDINKSSGEQFGQHPLRLHDRWSEDQGDAL